MTSLDPGERLAILRMIESRQISAEQALDLLDALESTESEDTTLPGATVEEEAWMLTALLQVTEAISSPTPNQDSLDDMLGRVARIVPLLAGVDVCSVWLQRNGDGLARSARYPLAGPAGACDEDPLLLREVCLSGNVGYAGDGACARVMLPMATQGRVVGVMGVDRLLHGQDFNDKETAILANIACQAAVGVENMRLRQEAVERARLERELQLARSVQRGLLPEGPPGLTGWEIASYWQAAHSVGGDFYDFIPLGRDRLGVVVADVSDKGMSAALFMALSRSILRASVTRSGAARTLARANRLICADAREGMFVTVFYCLLDGSSDEVVYASAGHNPPLLVSLQGAQYLPMRGMALGIEPSAAFADRRMAVRPGEAVVMYTDGLTEATNEQGEQFGSDRLLEAVRGAADRPPAAIIEHVMQDITRFAGDQPVADDATIVVARRVQA